MGRPSLGPRTQVLIRMRPEVFAEMVLLNPQLQGEQAVLRYGAISEHFNRLVMEDNERRRIALRTEAGAEGLPRG